MNKPQTPAKPKNIFDFITRPETASTGLIILFLLVALFGMFINPRFYRSSVQEGDIALKDIYAPYDFIYSWGVNEKKTNELRDKTVKESPAIFTRDIPLEEKSRARLGKFFDSVRLEKEKEVPLQDKVKALKNMMGEGTSDKDLKALLEYPKTQVLRKKSIAILDKVFLVGYITKEDASYLEKNAVINVVIVSDESGSEIVRKPEGLLTSGSIKKQIEAYAQEEFPSDKKVRQAVSGLIQGYASPNLKFDEIRTALRKETALGSIKPAYQLWKVKKNELVIERGERVTARHVSQIDQIRRIFKPGATPKLFLGSLLLFTLLALVTVVYFSYIQKQDFLKDTKGVAIVILSMFIMMVLADFITRSPQPSYFIPMASMGMMITLLVGFNVAFLSVVLMSILISMMVGGKIEIMFVLLIGSIAGMFAVRGCRRRANILWAGLIVGVAKFASIMCIGLINNIEFDYFIKDGVWGVASGIFSGFLVMGLLPVFEYLFKVPTNISLLELSDLNHPLLKKLALEAPGTYHHCILVGNLAESACDAIGANSLLARVGAYYHDIGKIEKAEYFGENEMNATSRHAKLTPSMSALIIAKHVKEGVEIAKKYKLNSKIVDFITQHHGDSLIAYFYQKALEKTDLETELREENFRYPGPRPQTKESAIILLADSVEASSRALDNPTPSSIRHLVKKIINNKFIDGQLDECDLTLKDMHKIADSFVRVLMGVYHTRMTYPEEAKRPQANGKTNGSKNKSRKPKQKKKD